MFNTETCPKSQHVISVNEDPQHKTEHLKCIKTKEVRLNHRGASKRRPCLQGQLVNFG